VGESRDNMEFLKLKRKNSGGGKRVRKQETLKKRKRFKNEKVCEVGTWVGPGESDRKCKRGLLRRKKISIIYVNGGKSSKKQNKHKRKSSGKLKTSRPKGKEVTETGTGKRKRVWAKIGSAKKRRLQTETEDAKKKRSQGGNTNR